jgi:hypothetical protein
MGQITHVVEAPRDLPKWAVLPMTPRESAGSIRSMSQVLLIGGPSDGQEIDRPSSATVLDIEGSRYVLRRARGRDEQGGWVGIFLPLYAGALKARFARRQEVRTGA